MDPLQELELVLKEKVEYPFAAFWNQCDRIADFLRQADDVTKIIQQAIGLLVILVGPRGGGKTTSAVWWVKDRKESEPDTPVVANVPITGAIYVPDILKFLATKLAVEGEFGKNYDLQPDNTVIVKPRSSIPARMLIIIDEAAISGFEARGSGVGSPLHTYLLALSRKLNVDIVLISQMMSMADKRAQWLADFYWLCEAKFVSGTWELDYFRYRVYDEQYRKTQEFNLWREDAKATLFDAFDTYDIPNYEALAEAFTIEYQITDEDIQFYEDIRDHKQHIPKQPISENVSVFWDKKALRPPSGRWPGETFLVMGPDQQEHRYEIIQRDWDMGEGRYKYRAKEIPNNTLIESPDDEADMVAPEATA
jgi:hypothetical protein